MKLQLKRIYDPVSAEDGVRILVDRLWPRGISKQAAHIDIWAKQLAPSTALRKWFGHDAKKWPEFQHKYLKELETKSEEIRQLKTEIKEQKTTLLYAAKDKKHHHALVLLEFLKSAYDA